MIPPAWRDSSEGVGIWVARRTEWDETSGTEEGECVAACHWAAPRGRPRVPAGAGAVVRALRRRPVAERRAGGAALLQPPAVRPRLAVPGALVRRVRGRLGPTGQPGVAGLPRPAPPTADRR